MKLYLITATTEDSKTHVIWGGSQSDAASARKEMLARGATRKDTKTYEVDVPTGKGELMQFLNDLGNNDITTLIAIRNLIGR
jgi:hypothetical protein